MRAKTYLTKIYCNFCPLIFILLGIRVLNAFNIDVRHPVIISNLADGPESYFGASVQLLRSNDQASWILVGAPRANSSHVNYTNVFEPGVIWRCSLGKNPESCKPVDIDPHGERLYENAVADRKHEAWLGASMSDASSDRFVSCASRWVNNPFWWRNPPKNEDTTDYLLHGICYWQPTEDILDDKPSALPNNYRIIPLRPIPGRDDTFLKQAKFYWTYGQVGFSSYLGPDKSLILGAPGLDNWRGSVIKVTDGPRTTEPYSNVFANNLVVRPELQPWLQNSSYLGYAVSAGNFFKDNDSGQQLISYVGGAPRGRNLTGEVVVFNFPASENGLMNVLQTLTPSQNHSYFGSVLCVVDLNGDGLDDLIVGAPRFSTLRRNKLPKPFGVPSRVVRDESSASSTDAATPSATDTTPSFGVQLPKIFESGDEGAAFVYISSGASLEQKEILNGDNHAWSQFGSAIASAGDLNHDGFNDIVVGAPYENKGTGCIYIYHGTRTGVSRGYSQKICAEDLDEGLKGFGYSISRGLDFDNNGYFDIAVGSYASAQAVVLRSKPTMLVTGTITTSVSKLPLDSDRFRLTSCVKYTGIKLPESLVIGVRILMDTDVKPPRVSVRKLELEALYKELVYAQLAHFEQEACIELEAVVVTKNIESNQPIKIRQQVFLLDKDQVRGGKLKRAVTQATKLEIKREAGRVSVKTSGGDLKDFCSTCPVLSKPELDTTSFSLPIEVLCGNDEKCTADLRIEATFDNIRPGDNFTIGTAPTVTLLISVKNLKETAMLPAVIVSYARRNLARIPPTCQIVSHESTQEHTIKCSLGRPLENEQVADLALSFDMSDLVAGRQAFEKEYVFHIEATTTSDMVAPSTLSLLLPINATADVLLMANRYELLFSSTTLLKYQLLSHTYDVRLYGPSPLADIWLRFRVPVNITNDGATVGILQVFYPQAEVDGIDVLCRAGNGYFYESSSVSRRSVAPELLQADPSFDAVMMQSSASRERLGSRDLKKRDLSSLNSKRELASAGTIHFDCNSKHVDCMEIRCKFNEFKPNSRGRVHINARISSNTTRKLFEQHHAQVMIIQSDGEINLMNLDENIQSGNLHPDKAQATTTIRLERPKPVRKRYIVAGILIGLLLLFIIVFSLYSCGCLQRKRAVEEEPVEEAEAEPLRKTSVPPVSPTGDPLDPIKEEHEDRDSEASGPPSFVP